MSVPEGAAPKLTKEFIDSRVARFKDVIKNRGSFGGVVDSHIEQHRKKIYPVMGSNVTSGDAAAAQLAPEGRFSINFMQCGPGKYPAMHAHDTLEVFIPITGRWRFFFEEDGKTVEIEGEPYDVVSAPIGMMRTLQNISDKPAIVMAVIGLDDDDRAGLGYVEEQAKAFRKAGVSWDDRWILKSGPEIEEGDRF
ncbi:MAG: hypothetical protein EXQ97_06075 [Alphaproteobacteria bacterium]|nr:hypothetical protein [Alphaproteobacteria bacterium]